MSDVINYMLPSELANLDGSESIAPGASVRDFWAWALGDLRLNSTRGLLSQYLVALAVGDERRVNDSWAPYDVRSDSGIKIEVKTSAFLQSWRQTRLSTISFSGLITRSWTDTEGYSPAPEVVADVYVFCVQTCKEPTEYDPLNMDQWEFHVVPASVIAERNQKSMGIATVRALSSGAVQWSGLRAQIELASKRDCI